MRWILSLAVAVSFLLIPPSLANVTISVSGTGTATADPSSPTSGQAFTLTTNGTVLVKVYADSSTDIGRITLTGSGTVSLLVGSSGSFPSLQSTPFTTFLSQDWSGLALSSFSGTVRVAGAIGQDLKDSVTADELFRFDVGRDVSAELTATGVDPSSTEFAVGEIVVHRSITSAGGIFATASPAGAQTLTLRLVRTGADPNYSNTDMAGSIITYHGTILSIVAADDMTGNVGGATLADTYDPAIQIGGSTTGTLSGRMTFDGDIVGNIQVREASGGTFGGAIFAGGDILGSIHADHDLGPISADGDLGGSITAEDGDCAGVDVGGNVYASIQAHSLGYFNCDQFASGAISDFGGGYIPIGSFTVNSLGVDHPKVYCNGDFDVFDVLVDGSQLTAELHFESIPAGHTVRFGAYLRGYVFVHDNAGLGGQVIITNVFDGGAVVIGTGGSQISIQDRDYTETSAQLGGGAVGIPPYFLHLPDCVPPHNEDGACGFATESEVWPSSFGGGTRDTIKLRHKGPVFNSSSNVPVAVYVQSVFLCSCGRYDGDHTSWADYTSSFDVYLPPEHPREVWISCKLSGGNPQAFDTAYQIKVSPTNDGYHTYLRSADTFDDPAPEVTGYPYIVNPLCPMAPPP
jgi:hypothetical protein